MRTATLLAAAATLTVLVVAAEAGPNRYGHSDRVERHMLPAVSTGPTDPAWSPDGRWIAFSMRGDIWKVPAEGGDALALTEGPAYHFEPAWSPDGTRIALSMDVDGNLDIGVVDAAGGPVERVTTDPQVDVEPEWSADGRGLYFVSARGRGFRIYHRTLGDTAVEEIAAGVQPALSPDGSALAYVAPVPGRLGSGGLWVKALAPGSEPVLVRYEETEYRMKPAWTPDGNALLYVSDERGSDDVVAIPVGGGAPVRLTVDTLHELSPSPSPDGTRFAFVSNREGPTTLYTVDIDGGPYASWTEVPLRQRVARHPTGRLRGQVSGPDGEPVPARIYLAAADGRSYAPDGGFHRVIAATETHYFHARGTFEVEVPAGTVALEAVRGFEYRPVKAMVEVPGGGIAQVELRLERLVDLPDLGWYSGDTHLHDLHQGRFGLTHEDFFLQTEAEDLHVANALIHMDGTRLMGRWGDLTGRPDPLSTPTHILQYAEEFRGSLGHVALLGIQRYVLPFISGTGSTVYAAPVLDLPYFDAAREQGGLAGFVHPYLNAVTEPSRAAGSLVPLDAALGRGDFYDIGALYSDEVASTEMYYRLLNAGFRIPATAGTDNFSDVWRDPPPGADRTFVRVDGSLSVEGWMEGIRAGRTFGSTGPILLLDVAGREPGEEIALAGDAPTDLHVRVELRSIMPVDTVAVVVNGAVAATLVPDDPARAVLEAAVDVPEGGWIAARARGPSSRYVSDSYAFAQTSPVYVVRGDRRWTSPEDARFLGEAVAALWGRIRDADWPAPADRDRFRAAVEQAEA
ncbi:MAG TPA: CehA/McbA family metallohydrolase, partial [Longimicrobiales bacterium]|nr:CehA/McbA family metallohydrolase [Longimicrobiales bacterium]